MGEYHLRKYLADPGAEVVGIHDTHPERAASVARGLGVRVMADLAQLLFEADAITVATSTTSHFTVTRQALEAGVHVLVEKPISPLPEDGERLAKLARERSLVLQVGFLERYRVKELLRNQEVGEVRYLRGERLSVAPGRDASIDVISDLLVHDLDLSLALVAGEPVHVSAMGLPVTSSGIDLVNARLEFSSGAVVDLDASRVSAKQSRKIRLYATRGYFSLDLAGNRLEKVRVNGSQLLREVKSLEFDALAEQCRDFLATVRKGGRPMVTAEEAVRTQRLAQMIGEKVDQRIGALQIRGAVPAHELGI